MGTKLFLESDFMIKALSFSKKETKSIYKTIDLFFDNPKSSSFSMHKINNIKCDSKFWSIRVNKDLRIILFKESNIYYFVYVDHHDDAYSWCEGKYFTKSKYNDYFVYDKNMNFSKMEYSENTIPNKSLFDGTGVKAKHLSRLGLSREHSELILEISDEDYLMKFISFLPEDIQEVIIDLATKNRSLDNVMNELLELEKIKKNSEDKIGIRFIDYKKIKNFSEKELISNFEKWKIFLHPKQKKLVEKQLNGPCLIEGGPGTGKTIVGIHRLMYLKKNIYKDSNDLYFFTFNKNISKIVDKKIDELFRLNNLNNNINVNNVDSFFYKLLENNNLVIEDYYKDRMNDILKMIFEDKNYEQIESFAFFKKEYYEVIQKNQIQRKLEYLNVNRTGMGAPIRKNKRERVWPYFKSVLNFKNQHNIYDYEDRAKLVIDLVKEGKINKFIDSVIIDEAQDLTPIKIKAVYSLVKNEKNNIMVLSDHNQRIFSLNSWKKETSLKVVGRTYYLTLNYRTTKEITNFAVNQYEENSIKKKYMKEYKSFMSGPYPVIKKFYNYTYLMNFVVNILKKRLKNYKPGEIAIITHKNIIKDVKGTLNYLGIGCILFDSKLKDIDNLTDKINLVPMHLSKGLEYRIVIALDIPVLDPDIENNSQDNYTFEIKFQLYESMKYVTYTRARDIIYLISKEQS